MGQQSPFETLDRVVHGLRRADARARGIKPEELPKLDYYDLLGPPDGAGNPNPARGVDNRKDPDATTPLIAHGEYWDNPLIFELLHRNLTAEG